MLPKKIVMQMPEKLNEKSLACSFGIVAAIAYVICAVLWMSTPSMMMYSSRAMMHGFAPTVPLLLPSLFFVGLIEIVIIAAALGYAIAYFYNAMLPKRRRR